MKRILAFLILALCLSANAQTVITSLLTVTNSAGTANGETISVNGHVRTWTNNVVNGLNQIPIAANIKAATSNLFVSFATVPETTPLISITQPATNEIFFRSLPGSALTIAVSSGWAIFSYTTNTITNAVPIRAPASVAGGYEYTNAANALMDYLNSTAMGTNVFTTNNNALQHYRIDQSGLTNFALMLSTNATNFTLSIGLNATNYTALVSNYFGVMLEGLDTAAFEPKEEFQPACAVLSNLCSLGTVDGLSYIEAGTGNILLSNTNGNFRLRANEGGDFWLYWEDEAGMVHGDTSHNFTLLDHSENARYEFDNAGPTYFRGPDNVVDMQIHYGSGQSGAITVRKPFTVDTELWPTVVGGGTTNFIADADNSLTSDTTVNSFNVPAGTMATNGDFIVRTVGVKFLSGGGTKRVQVYFAGTQIFDSTALSTTSESYLSVRCEITRRDSGTVEYNSSATGTGFTPVGFANVGTIGGIDFTADNSCYVILTSSTSGDFVRVQSDNVRFYPSSTRAAAD